MISKKYFFVWRKLLFIVGVSRVLLVFLIFKYPLLALILSYVLDDIDSMITYKSGLSWEFYTRYDKLLDYWWYIFVLFFAWNSIAFNVLLILFVIRTIGQVIVLFTTKHEPLLWFPNIFEHYFILYLLSKLFWPQYLTYFVGFNVIIPLFIATITKMPQEYLLHRKGWFYNSRTWSKSITDLSRFF